MAEKVENRAVELDIGGKKRVFDIDDPKLPDWIEEKAFGSDDYSYDTKLDNKDYEKTLKLLQIELVKVQVWQQKTGTRIMTTLINGLQSRDKQFGLETMCVGGGQGMAIIIERLS